MVQTKRNPAADYHPIAGDSARSGHALSASATKDMIRTSASLHRGTQPQSSARTQNCIAILENRLNAIHKCQLEHLVAIIVEITLISRITVHPSRILVCSNCDLERARRWTQALYRDLDFEHNLGCLVVKHVKLLSKLEHITPVCCTVDLHSDPVVVPAIVAKGS